MMTKTTSQRKVLLKQLVVISLCACLTFLFSIKTEAQPLTQNSQNEQVSASKEGVSQELIDKYNQIFEKCTKQLNGSKAYTLNYLSAEDISQMKTIFLAMSEEQQLQQKYIFKRRSPLSEQIPSEKQLELWRDTDTYGVWIDGVKTANSKLNNFKADDFKFYMISKLVGSGKINKKYDFQVNLETTSYFNTQKQNTLADENLYLTYNRPNN